ncbi:linoleate 13S-lipoxygenase 2-1, chloroplastic-like [Nicotiana sylvestris]|uniref:linoleate 13S-lipoxygenase 2-1, chloroplastic-like n=1 Tax=Nicotiana sylvestris TaxID=4096 RepID=UPI00388CC6BA
MEINALAREALINANGIIDSSFFPGKYAVELSSVAYGLEWRFDRHALPEDLINRGMAVKDPNAPYGLKLTIEDYPFANDGLVLWDILKQWKDEPWWPELKTPDDLKGIITTIVWVTSGHHTAVNFGQYSYAGYFPNRPTTARAKMPTEDPTDEEWENFLKKPEDALLKCFPSQIQAEDPVINVAFEKFSGRLKELEGIIDGRNADSNLMNRNGAGVVPYELLKPFSGPGVTGKGVPYSISI